MTRVLFLPDDQTFVLLRSELAPQALVTAVQEGTWFPPEPYRARPGLQALSQGRLVIVSTSMARSEPPDREHEPPVRLSPRQNEVLQLLAEGLTTKEIAVHLGLRPRTVNMHITAIKRLLDTQTRAQLIGRAAALGLCRLRQHTASRP